MTARYDCFNNVLRSSLRLLAFLSVALPLAASAQAIKFDSATISGLPARNIGSATMSGRIAAVAAVRESGRLTVFVGIGQRRSLEVGEWRYHVQPGV